MTDNEIIKALECCEIGIDFEVCDNCPRCVEGERAVDCVKRLHKCTLDLINRQKAEVSKLQCKNSELEIELKAMRGAANSYKAEVERLRSCDMQIEVSKKLEAEIKSEAYKELAERLKNSPSVTNCENEWLYLDIDNLLTELTERKEDEGK